MSAAQILERASNVLTARDATYGDATTSMAAIAARWSLTSAIPSRRAGRPLHD